MSLKLLKKQAEQALKTLEDGKSYTSEYVVSRLNGAWDKHEKDQVIANVRNVIVKMASKQQYFSQAEITGLYNKFCTFGGSSFKDELSDLMIPNYGEIKKEASSNRRMYSDTTNKPITTSAKNDLTDAFSVLFSFGNSNDVGTHNKNLTKKAERVVSLELNSLGMSPDLVKAVTSNEHFILCNAYYKNNDFSTSHISIPVNIENGSPKLPDQVISNGELLKLNKENILVQLKIASSEKKNTNIEKYAELRQTNSVNIPMVSPPKELMEKFDISEELLFASKRYTADQIKLATSVIGTELKSWGARAQIKLSGSNDRHLKFTVKTATAGGEKTFEVPVEISDNKVSMPSTFMSGDASFDFSRNGFNDFIANESLDIRAGFKFSRDRDELEKMSYIQLMDLVIDGVANKDYKISEDALDTISAKFGPEKFKIALDEFQKLIKISSRSNNDEIVKAAIKRGDLIKRSGSIELYCPKLGLPLSKIAFDEQGRPVRKFRTEKTDLESLDGTVLSSSKILLS